MKLVAWLSVTLAGGDPAPVPVDPAKAPVVLVHGIDGSARDMTRLARAFRAQGHAVYTPSLQPNNGSAPIDVLSAQLATFIQAELPPAQAFHLIGYSMGGIITRHYLQNHAPLSRIRHYASLSAPHHGTLTAFLRRGPGAKQMRLGSSFLRQLNQPHPSDAVPTTSFWTPTDLIILPATSSRLSHGQNLRLLGLGHFSCIIEKRCIDRVIAHLNQHQTTPISEAK